MLIEIDDKNGIRGGSTMRIRNAEKKDIAKVLHLLNQVLEIHAALRPDIFIPKTTKYTEKELLEIFADNNRQTYVATDENDNVLGYAFCILKKQPHSNNMVPFTSFFIDDLCVDSGSRGQHIGLKLFAHVKQEAKKMGCYEITLNVWEGNDAAKSFYEKIGMKTKETQMEYILDT